MRVTVTADVVLAAFDAVKDDPSFDESRGLTERGLLPVEMLQAMCLRPEILRAFAGFGRCVYPGGLLERRLKELVILTVSQANDCQFCTSSHCDLVRIEGIAEDALALLDRPAAMTPRERIAVDYARAAVDDPNAIPAALAGTLAAAFSDPEQVELTFLIGYISMLNVFNNALGIRYHGEYRVLSGRRRAEAKPLGAA